jgi:hypothetical protein
MRGVSTQRPLCRWQRLWLVAAVVLLPVGHANAGDAYYVLVFGSQTTPARAKYSHSFATFVHVSWEGSSPCPVNPSLKAHTISWLPETLDIRVWALLPECGANFDLDSTIRYALDNNERVSLWGPYQIEPELYNRAMQQLGLLGSGQVRYKADDTAYKTDRVSNCIHAISSVAGGYRLRVASPGWGETASYAVVRRYLPWVIDRNEVHAWVGSALGLDRYPIIYRDLQSPRSGFFGPVYRAVGGERYLAPSYGPPVR